MKRLKEQTNKNVKRIFAISKHCESQFVMKLNTNKGSSVERVSKWRRKSRRADRWSVGERVKMATGMAVSVFGCQQ